MPKKVRILLVSEVSFTRDGLRALLTPTHSLEIVAETKDWATALSHLQTAAPDVILMDSQTPGRAETALVSHNEQGPMPPILAFGPLDAQRVEAMLEWGVAGYILHNAPAHTYARAIRKIAKRQPYYSDPVLPIILAWANHRHTAATQPAIHLTTRQRQVLIRLGKDKSNKQIAEDLGIAVGTVETHVSRVFATLGVGSRTGAALWAIRHGMTDDK